MTTAQLILTLLPLIAHVETGGEPFPNLAVGKGGERGYTQIGHMVLEDWNAAHEECQLTMDSLTNPTTCRMVSVWQLSRLNAQIKAIRGRDASEQELARAWNAGLRGMLRGDGQEYYGKIKKAKKELK